MSGIAAVSGQISSVSTASFLTTGASAAGALGAGAAGGTGAADGLGQAGQAGAAGIAGLDVSATGGLPAGLSVQTSSLIASAQPNANIQNMAALLLSLLLSKSNDDSKDKDDPWKMLVGMAMLGMLAQQNQSVTMTQSSASVSQAYGAAGASAAAGATVNVQG